MAIILAIFDGHKDANSSKSAYFWAIVSDSKHRIELLKDGWKQVGKVVVVALILDLIYQLKVFGRVYPGEMVIVAFVLAIIPYVLMRGPINRIMRRMGLVLFAFLLLSGTAALDAVGAAAVGSDDDDADGGVRSAKIVGWKPGMHGFAMTPMQ